MLPKITPTRSVSLPDAKNSFLQKRLPPCDTFVATSLPSRSQLCARSTPIQAATNPHESAPLVARQALWQEVEESAYASLPELRWSFGSLPSLLGLLWRIVWNADLRSNVLDATFAQPEDIRPDREKIFHTYGTVAKVMYEPFKGNHPFTGLFASHTPLPALIRLSLATDESNYVPGVALKFFVPNNKSLNVHAIPSLSGQKSKCFFAEEPTTSLPKASFPALLLEKALATLREPRHLVLDVLAQVQADGCATAEPAKAPFRLIFRNGSYQEVDTKGCQEDFRSYLAARYRPKDELYQVWATEQEGSDPVCIGRIVMDSDFVASSFGDRRLHFQHAHKEMLAKTAEP